MKSDQLGRLMSHFDLAMQGESPIFLASSSRSGTKTVEVLIKCKANVNYVDNKVHVVLVLHAFATLSFLY